MLGKYFYQIDVLKPFKSFFFSSIQQKASQNPLRFIFYYISIIFKKKFNDLILHRYKNSIA